MNLRITYPEFFGPREKVLGFDQALVKCVAHKTNLSVQFKEDAVYLDAPNSNYFNGALRIGGGWKSSYLNGDPVRTGSLILLPFLINIQSIELHASQLVLLNRSNMVVADWLARVYFFSACRKEQISVQASAASLSPKVISQSKEFVKHYLWMVRALCADSGFARASSIELVLANAHFDVSPFERAMLNAGFDEFREICSRNANPSPQGGATIGELTSLRRRVLSLSL